MSVSFVGWRWSIILRSAQLFVTPRLYVIILGKRTVSKLKQRLLSLKVASEHLAKEHQIEIINEEDDNGDVEEEMRSTTALPRKRGRPRSQGNKGKKLMRKNNLLA